MTQASVDWTYGILVYRFKCDVIDEEICPLRVDRNSVCHCVILTAFGNNTFVLTGVIFVPGAIILMLFMAVVTTIETIGDISATTMGGDDREATDKEISGGIMADGVGTVFGSLFNAMPNTSYSQNAGLVAFTGVVSRHVGTVAGVILILMGLFPKLGGIIASMPESVIGGAAIIMFGLIASAGIKLIAREKMNQRNESKK